jgi:hypothetical protein
VTGRPRSPHGGGPDDTGTRAEHPWSGASETPRPQSAANVDEGHAAVAQVFQAGRVRSTGDGSGGPDTAQVHPDDVLLAEIIDRYDQLGNEPPEFNIAANDRNHHGLDAHTGAHHGPEVPLTRAPAGRTVEGRIYGDDPWRHAENYSLRWTDHTTMNRTVNEYVRQNWEQIRTDLALRGRHNGGFDAGHRVGEGYYNNGMYGAGPRDARYLTTSLAVIRIWLVPGSDPPEPFVRTAFPAGLL